ncbi:IS110 family transposase [Streptomyces sp. NBC_01669]|uniref:IS110 family transposase n=1 Tax=Streptomyces sp. NBC_01669 TaxID=2975909 RepID=UPI002252E652|nr:IS110 family transposase [Streptomyces sp. NBC_01669]MCX4537866.1 IS110 family transposase [Streptomyces sp. NBC_01669]
MPSITQSAAPCHIPADAAEEVLLGVDTHMDVHAAAVTTVLGGALDGRSFPATAQGYRQLVAWARSFGVVRRAGVECTGSYGAALARHVHAEGIEVTEVNQPDKAARRRHGKTDAVDAEAAARAVLSGRATATAKASDGPVEMLRLFELAKGSAIKSRTQAINQLKSVLVCADSALREALASLTNPHLIKRCAALEALDATGPATAARHTLRLPARRIQHLTEEIDDLNQRIAEAVKASTPGLLDVRGVGPDSAAALLIAAGDNPERLTSEASFAALCGTSPVEASSGKTERRRLNRGGDRQANAALYRIVLSRVRWDDRTQPTGGRPNTATGNNGSSTDHCSSERFPRPTPRSSQRGTREPRHFQNTA